MKAFLFFLFTVLYFNSEAQVDKIRGEFFTQIIGELREEYSRYQVLVKIRGDREPWDTTGNVYSHYFTHCDTTNKNDLSLRSQNTRKMIRILAKALTDHDYREIKTQIANQYADDFFPKHLIEMKLTRKRKGSITMMYSQPLVAADGSLIFLLEEFRSDGSYGRVCNCYKLVNGRWTHYLSLYNYGGLDK